MLETSTRFIFHKSSNLSAYSDPFPPLFISDRRMHLWFHYDSSIPDCGKNYFFILWKKAFTCPELIIETLEQGVKYVELVQIVNFEQVNAGWGGNINDTGRKLN